MRKQRKHPAERLSDVLELLYARRSSGLLSVERFEGQVFEEGEIYLERGKPVYARVDTRMGKGAFSWLSTWQQIYFAFDKDAPNPMSQAPAGGTTPPVSSPQQETAIPSARGSAPLVSTPSPNIHFPLSGVEHMVPRRQIVKDNVLEMPLTRTQRSIYLLIDGRRTIADLARCLGKNLQEVSQALRELQEQGLIMYEIARR